MAECQMSAEPPEVKSLAVFLLNGKGLKKDEWEKVGAMKNRNLLFLYILFTMIFSLNSPAAFSGTATLSWDDPTTNADGTPLTDLAGYKVYYGNFSGNYSQNMNVDNVTTYTVNNLTDGLTYYFAVTAYDTSGNESGYSNELSKTIQLPQYTLTINKGGGGNGTVISSPAGINCGSVCSEVYKAGTVVTLTALPDTNCTFAGWSGGGCSGAGQCVFTMNANTSVTAFILNTYSITATAGTGGTISPSGMGSVNYGASQTFTITPNANYHVADVQVDGFSVGAVTSYTFNNVTANHTINATFAINSIPMHTITASAGANGTIFPSGVLTVNDGASQSFTITPNASYHVADVQVDSSSVGPVTSYTFTKVSANHTISASFTINSFTVTPSAGTGGSISPSTPQTVNYNQTTSFTVTPNAGYLASVTGCGGMLSGNTYMTGPITGNCTVTATFAINTFTITASAGTGGSISPSGTVSVNYEANQTFSIKSNKDYRIVDVKIDGSSVGAVSAYTFGNITNNHTIEANFVQKTSMGKLKRP